MKFNQEVWAHDFTWMFLEDMLLVVNAPPLHERTASRFMTLWSVYFRAEPSFKCKYWSIKWVYKAQSYVHFRLQMFPLDDTTFVIMHFWHILLCFQVPLLRFRPPGSKTPFSAARARARRSRRWALRGCSLQASISCDMAKGHLTTELMPHSESLIAVRELLLLNNLWFTWSQNTKMVN